MQNGLFEKNRIALRALWPEQVPALDAIYAAIKEGHKRIVLYAPTGMGKTQLAAHMIARGIDKGSRPLFTCPGITLVDQTLRKFEAEGIYDIGVIQADHERTNPDAQVQIACIPTLIRRTIDLPDFVIVDECHLVSKKWNEWLDKHPDILAVGLSATPWTKGLGHRWTKMVIGARIQQLIDAGRLCDFRIYAPAHGLDRKAVKTERGEFVEESASQAMSKATIVGDVVKEWFEKGPGEKTFLFCVNRNHARTQMGAFIDSGFPFGYIDGETSREDRQREFQKMAYGEIAGIASVGCLIAGVDEDVRCIIDCAPTLSEIRLQQKWGRGLRTVPGIDKVLIGLDHANNNGETGLGLFSEIFHDHLDASTTKQRKAYEGDPKPAKSRVCKNCSALVPARAWICPACGERMGKQVKEAQGTLIELERKVKPIPEERQLKRKQAFYSEVLDIARRWGCSEGWAAHQFKAKFGDWPNGLSKMSRRASKRTYRFVNEQYRQYKKAKATAQPEDEEYHAEY